MNSLLNVSDVYIFNNLIILQIVHLCAHWIKSVKIMRYFFWWVFYCISTNSQIVIATATIAVVLMVVYKLWEMTRGFDYNIKSNWRKPIVFTVTERSCLKAIPLQLLQLILDFLIRCINCYGNLTFYIPFKNFIGKFSVSPSPNKTSSKEDCNFLWNDTTISGDDG